MITGKGKAAFGSGDILITPACRFRDGGNKSVGAILLNNQAQRQVGEYVPSVDIIDRIKQSPIILSFTNVASIDVLIAQLEVLKNLMDENSRQSMNLISCDDLSFI